MKWFREHTRLTVILTILLILVIIIVISFNFRGNSSPVGRAINKVFAYVQEPLSDAGNGIKNGARGIFRFKAVVKENDELKKEIAELKKELTDEKLTAAKLQDLTNLSKVLGYSNIAPHYNYVTADVVALDGADWFNIFTINAGSNSGLQRDTVVVNGDGLVGRVFEVGDSWAKVISLIDESNRVSFRVKRDLQLLGILYGDGSGGLTGFMLNPDASVVAGDTLITSGMGTYPEGIEIGTVKEVTWNNDSLLKTVTIKPSVSFSKIQRVTVLIPNGQ